MTKTKFGLVPIERNYYCRVIAGDLSGITMESTSTLTTIISDLDDKCLFAVFNYLDLMDLRSVADVCTRMRYSAKSQHAKCEEKRLYFPIVLFRGNVSLKSMLLQTSRALRVFGAHVQRFHDYILRENHYLICEWGSRYPQLLYDNWGEVTRSKYQRNIFELLLQY